MKLNVTETERIELITLLNMVLTNNDQWKFMDLSALRRVAKKLGAEK